MPIATRVIQTALSTVKLMRADPETQEKGTETVKQNYSKYFGI